MNLFDKAKVAVLMRTHPLAPLAKRGIELQHRFQDGEAIPKADVDEFLLDYAEGKVKVMVAQTATRLGRQNAAELQKTIEAMDKVLEKMTSDLKDPNQFTLSNGMYNAVLTDE